MLRIHDPIIFRIASRLLQIEQIDELESIHEAYKQQPKVNCSKPNFEKWLRLQNRRENIYYTPLSDDKHHILIDDMTAENVAKLRKDGSYPRVKLLYAEKQECDYGSRAYLTARTIAKKYEEQERERKAQSQHVAQRLPQTSATTAYFNHYDDIRQHMSVEDFSRLDAMIAVRMRATGHSSQAVMDAIAECAPAIRTKEGRNWQKYAERTAAYAFGVAGYLALQRFENYTTH